MPRRGSLEWLVLAVALAAGGGGDARCGDAPAAFVYVRDKATIARTVESIAARTIVDDAVLFVFDTATFDPPPGKSEFTAEHAFREDLPAWTFALADAVRRPAARIFVAATTSQAAVELTPDRGFSDVLHDLEFPWWSSAEFKEFEPAHKALARLVAKVPGRKRTIVLVCGATPPERWIRQPPAFMGWEPEPWRLRLSDVGAYLDAERLGAAVLAAGASLVVVAPETRFGDFLPVEEVPWAPWASRPVADELAAAIARDTTPSAPDRGGSADFPSMSEEEIQKLAEQMRRRGVPEDAIQAAIGELRRKAGLRPPATPGSDPAADDGPVKGGRFMGRTPRWTMQVGQQIPFATDVPSAYGWWPLARAAAKAGGAYYFYPFPPSDWADTCPRDMSLIDSMQPELVPEGEFVGGHAGDAAQTAMLAAQRIVLDVTPWTDCTKGWSQGGAPSWCGFAAASVRTPKWRPREKPRDWLPDEFAAKANSWKAFGAKIAGALPAYDRATKGLADAYVRLRDAKWAGVPRRSQANLRLCCFWFETSAFHLEALSIYLKELDRFMPPGSDDKVITITYVPTIRMSDCLDAYDGRVISKELEARYRAQPAMIRADLPPGYQGNLLSIPISDRNYRAKRNLDDVLEKLDPRLRPRALRLIDAAREVMAHDAKSPWGWITYYDDVDTFVWREVTIVPGEATKPHPPPPDDDGGPSTPKGPGSGGAGPGTPK